ncbi:hypothetical protein Tco_1059973 [Tanacetum coccineum]
MAGGNDFNENEKVLQKDRWTLKHCVVYDGEGVDGSQSIRRREDYALMACNSSGSDIEREQVSDASIEIKAYTQGLKKVEAQLILMALLSYENDSLHMVFMNKESKLVNQPLYDSVETSEFVPEPTVNEPKVVSQPKVWSDAPIIEEYESDSEDEHVSLPTEEQETPSFANQQVKTLKETVELNKKMGKGDVQRENRPIWNNVQRVNHKNQFVPTIVLTKTGKIPVSTARASGTNHVSTA